MKLLIITHVQHIKNEQAIYGYAPYVREMNLWLRYVESVEIVAPIIEKEPSAIDLAYQHTSVRFTSVPAFSLISLVEVAKTIIKLPRIIVKTYQAMKWADHIHLRCPGNMGLIGCVLQIAFPKKPKTAKYAGNWDPKSKQPWTYRLQQKILRNTALTKNMQVLVYGEWPNETKNIKSFFTATYWETEKVPVQYRDFSKTLHFVFAGSLVKGKKPLLTIQIIEKLHQKGYAVHLDMYGEGVLKSDLIHYITTHQLESIVAIHGNQPKEIVKQAMQQAHFMILPSKSEGWPKVVAEAMFFGAIPIVTPVSCVPYMLAEGTRGILISEDKEEAIAKIIRNIETSDLTRMSTKAAEWSQQFTLDKFETEIKKLLT